MARNNGTNGATKHAGRNGNGRHAAPPRQRSIAEATAICIGAMAQLGAVAGFGRTAEEIAAQTGLAADLVRACLERVVTPHFAVLRHVWADRVAYFLAGARDVADRAQQLRERAADLKAEAAQMDSIARELRASEGLDVTSTPVDCVLTAASDAAMNDRRRVRANGCNTAELRKFTHPAS